MKYIKPVSMLLLGSTLLAGCATGLGGGGSASGDTVTVNNGKAFQGRNEVIIGGFKVTYITFDKDSVSARDNRLIGSENGYANATLRARLVGVDDATFQALTDQAYADFRQRLEAAGYTLADASRLTQHDMYRRVRFEEVPVRNTSSFKSITGGTREDVTFAPSGMPLIKPPTDAMPMPYHVQAIAADLGVPVLSVHYTVHFAGFSSDTDVTRNYNTGGNNYRAEVSLGQNIQILPGTPVHIYNGLESTFSHPNGSLELARGLATGAAFGESVDATSGAQKLANTFSGVVGVFTGGSASAKEININADPQRYRSGATEALTEANQRLIAQMTALR